MAESWHASELLKEAAAVFDSAENNLAKSARSAWRRGFASGGEWMREALFKLRGAARSEPNLSPEHYHRLGWVKYGLTLLATLLILALAILAGQSWLIFAAIPTFYFVEVQMAFLFPLAIDGCSQPFRESQEWTRRAGGTWGAMMVIMPIAATMLFGGFYGKGFVRSWSLGCLAILIWYERLDRLPKEISEIDAFCTGTFWHTMVEDERCARRR